MRLVSEFKRRKVIRMAVLYIVASWLLLQVAEVIIGLANLADWIGLAILWLLAIGFPIALILSWFYQITPDAYSFEKAVDPEESIAGETGRRINFIVISLLCAAVIVFAYDKWWKQVQPEKSIAVLPFVNMSDDTSNEYFSDGISEELLNVLSSIPELRVVSRTSAFFYKGKNINLIDVARELNVAHILEGSVRKAGNQVRVTAQLIEAHSDTHLWSTTYDRTLEDIFAIQDEIAAAVVARLKVTLLGEAPKNSETDPEAYRLVLQARHLHRLGTKESLEQALSLFEKALTIAPDYAAAWIDLSSVYSSLENEGLRPFEDAHALSLEAAERSLAIDSNFAPAHAQLGWIAMVYEDDLAVAARHFQHALSLEPANTDTITQSAALLVRLGRLDEAIALEEYVAGRDPVNSTIFNNLGNSYFLAGRWQDSITTFRTALRLSPGAIGAHYDLGMALLFNGDTQAAQDAFATEPDEEYRVNGTALAHHAMGRKAEYEEALAELIERWGEQWPAEVAHVYAFSGDATAAFAWLEKELEQGNGIGVEELLQPFYWSLHEDPRWADFLARAGSSPGQLEAIEFQVKIP